MFTPSICFLYIYFTVIKNKKGHLLNDTTSVKPACKNNTWL